MNEAGSKKRYDLIDTLRGITIISMVLFHTCWDLIYLGYTGRSDLLYGTAGVIWQLSICCSFILISGYCFPFGRRRISRSVITLLCGVLITAVTLCFMYDARDIFGVLWLLGLSPLMTIPVDSLCKRLSGKSFIIILIIALLCFFLTFDLKSGSLSFFGKELLSLPKELYSGYPMTLLGFKDPSFFSTDYFPLLPWYFLYLTGYALNRIFHEAFSKSPVSGIGFPPLSFIGRHSLLIYMLHQPVIYGILVIMKR